LSPVMKRLTMSLREVWWSICNETPLTVKPKQNKNEWKKKHDHVTLENWMKKSWRGTSCVKCEIRINEWMIKGLNEWYKCKLETCNNWVKTRSS
jgi:hypothetical protein